jgi:hypothetical protein
VVICAREAIQYSCCEAIEKKRTQLHQVHVHLRIVCSGASSKDEDYTVSESLLRLKTGVL